MRISRVVIGIVLLTMSANSSHASYVSVYYDFTQSANSSAPSSFDSNYIQWPVLDGIDRSVSATADGFATTTTSSLAERAVDTTLLSFSLTQSRGGTQYSSADSTKVVDFTILEDGVSYAALGLYQSSDGRTLLNASLRDLTVDQLVFLSYQESRDTENEVLVLGQLEGDFDNALVGSPVGGLVKGHTYSFFWEIQTYAFPDTDQGAEASGEFTLSITRLAAPTVTPEPTSLALAGCAGFGMAVGAWRRRRLQTSQAA